MIAKPIKIKTMKSKVVETLQNSNSIAIYTHINTDCDAIGSSLALREALLQLGKQVDVYVNSNFSNNFKIYGDLSFYNKKTSTEKYDLAVCLDSATEGRLGRYKFTFRKGVKTTLAIDHHTLSNGMYCKINYVRPSSSTCEIMYDILKTLKIKFTPYICKCLISGIATDTGKFSHSTTSNTFNVMGKLLKMGKFTMEEITTPLFNSMEMNLFTLLKRAYSRIEFYSENKLGIIMLRHSDFLETGTTIDDVNIFPDIPMQLDCVQFAILASEDDKGYFRVSFRSKGDVSARNVAMTFGGGGHLNASGCKIFGEFEEVKQRLLDSTFETLGWKK
ncbi:MAG: bifunctional oligoribonuclease/PAP phosphatase NrnA [Clostridia bacterium]|nr:bifunctional oligoribonuclease/PAP phosphatase NrnA [Clostridia bacterium]